MNDNHTDLLEKIERRVRTGQVSGDALVDDLADAAPQAEAGFQRRLEEELMARLYENQGEKINMQAHYDISLEREASKVPLTLVAAVLVLILLGTVVTSSGTTSTGAQADLRQTEAALQATQTAVVATQTQVQQPAPVVQIAATQTEIQQPVPVAQMDFDYGGHVASTDNAQTIDAMQQAGMTWMKIAVDDLGKDIEADIFNSSTNGFKLLVTVSAPPERLQEEGFIEAYADYVAELASMGVDAIEVWSEPNIDRSWTTGEISGAAYASLLKTAYQAIKAANPTTMVISAAPAPTGAGASFPNQVMNDDQWLREVVDSGGLDYLDCVGMHYIEGVIAPNQRVDDPRDNYYTRFLLSMIDVYRGIVRQEKPLCFTELGYLTGEGLGDLPPYFSWAANTTLDEQAHWLAQAVELAAKSQLVRLLMVWNVDFTAYEEDPQAGFAILRGDGRCPACELLAQVELSPAEAVAMPQANIQPMACEGAVADVAEAAMLRAYPSEDAESIMPIAANRELHIIGTNPQATWRYVEVERSGALVTGWIPADVLQPMEPCFMLPTPTPAQPQASCALSFTAPIAVSIYIAPTLDTEVIAQVAPTWQVTVLEQRNVDAMAWYRVQIGANDAQVVGWVPAAMLLDAEACLLPVPGTTE